MTTFLVAYDLNDEAKRPDITGKLHETFGTWAMLSESSYAVSTNRDAEAVYAVFEPLLDDNDQLYVITLSRPYTGFGPEGINGWLDDNLTY